MCRQGIHLVSVLLIILRLTPPGISQTSQPQAQPSQLPTNNSSEPVATFQASTRMVTLEVVARDGHGRHATGLKASDFRVFEQTPAREKEKHEQKIAAFREVTVADLAKQAGSATQIPAGVHTNLVTLQKNPVPPTILLVDGLNTQLEYQAQVHIQMLRMLRSLPANVPVAVFLFGHRLQMLQDFTSDPSLLQAALEKAISVAATGVARIDPRDDSDQVSAQVQNLAPKPGGTAAQDAIAAEVAALAQIALKFDLRQYAAQMDMRVNETSEALVSLARHVAGYPGRKNLLWISTSFPISLDPLKYDIFFKDVGQRNYWVQMQRVAAALSEAKVVVYPINPAGVRTPALYEAANRPSDTSGQGTADALGRETILRAGEQDTMQVLAEGTGGKVCTGDNDLGDCVRKAVDDSGTFYEIAYYPDSQNWNGEYRKITLKSQRPGLHLAYRQGYFARQEAGDNPKEQKSELEQAACEDYLNATSIFFAAKSLPPDSPEKLKFYLMVNTAALTLIPTSDGGRNLNIVVAVCTFDKKGSPLQLMSEPVNRKLSASEYQSLTAVGGLSHVVTIPGPKPVSLRLLIKDIPSGRLGSVQIKVEDSVAAPK